MKLLSFTPDLETTEPGVILDGDLFYSVPRGVRAVPSMKPSAMPALSGGISASYIRQKSLGVEVIAQIQTGETYAWDGATWNEITGPNIHPSGFMEFGDVMLSYGGIGFQERTAGTFTAVADSPYANVAFATDNGFVIAANGGLSGGDAGDDFWASSNIFDYSTWTPASGNVAANGRLYFPSGQITAGASLGQNAVLYKRNAIYFGSYLGPREKWLWPAISTSVGCVAQASLVVAEDAHFFLGEDDFYVFDGTRPRPISQHMREWMFANMDELTSATISGAYDPVRKIVVWTWRKISGAQIGVCYSLTTGLWGRANHAVTFVRNAQHIEALSGQNEISSQSLRPSLMGFDGFGQFRYSDNEYDPAWIMSGDFGHEEKDTDITKVRLRFVTRPQSVSGTHYPRDVYSDSFDSSPTPVSFTEDRVDTNQQSKFHRFRIDMTGDWEMAMFNTDPPKARR